MRKRSIMLIIATILSTAYAVYLFCFFVGTTASASDGAEALGGAIATALVTPHAIMFLIGAIFGWIGVFFKKSWAALVAAILYSVGSVLFLAYIMFGAPILILGFIGYANQKKQIKSFWKQKNKNRKKHRANTCVFLLQNIFKKSVFAN